MGSEMCIRDRYATWSKRRMPWMPGLLPADIAAAAVPIALGTQDFSEPTIAVRRRRDDDTGEVS